MTRKKGGLKLFWDEIVYSTGMKKCFVRVYRKKTLLEKKYNV